MSLLEQINGRKQEQAQAQATQEQGAMSELQKPDATVQSRQKRSDMSSAIAAGPEQELQEEEAGPEEQQMFSQMELEIVEALNGPKSSQLFKVIDTAQDPVEGVGLAASDVITGLREKYPQASDDILLGLGESAVEQIVDIYESMNESVALNEDQMAEAYSIGIQDFMQSNSDMVDPDMQEYMANEAPSQLPPQAAPQAAPKMPSAMQGVM